MSTSEQLPPEPDPVVSRRPGPSRPLIAAAFVALAVVVAAVAILPRITAPGPSSSFGTCCAPGRAALQALSLSMHSFYLPGLGSLDPVVAGGAYLSAEGQVARLLFDGLVTLDDANNVAVWGADRVDVSADGLTYTFHVRTGQSFSDGTSVNPSDYAWSIDRTFNPCVATTLAYSETGADVIKDSLAFVNESCAADHSTVNGAIKTLVGDSILPDDSAGTLTMLLAHPAAYFLEALAGTPTAVVERGALNGLGTDGIWLTNLTRGPTGTGGSGMFYLASWDHVDSLVLKPNPHWWGNSAGKKPNFTEIDIHLYSNATLDSSAFLASSYDYFDAAPRDSLIASQSRSEYHLVPELLVSSIAFEWESAPFNNADARQALCLALNRDTLEEDVLKSVTVTSGFVPALPTWHLVPQGMPGYNPQLTGVDGVTATSGDLAKAEAHWKAYLATLKGKPVPPVDYIYQSSSSNGQVTVANDIAAQWSNAFPDLKVRTDIPHTILAEGEAPFQALRFAWLADYPDPQDFLSHLFSTGATYNIGHVSVPGADTLMATADSLSDPTDQAARMRRYQQAEQELVQQVATCPLFQYQSAYMLRSDISGMRQGGLGFFPNDDWVTGYRAVN